VTLVPVHDSAGDWFDPPMQHLGADLPDPSAIAVAGLGLAYLEALIAEAEAL
jgi:hypothetical protein